MSKGKKHSEQFEKYLQGELSSEKAHAFERDSLDDEFTQEAIDGFEDQGIQYLADLGDLQKKISNQKVSGISWSKLVGIAAVLLMASLFVFIAIDLSETNRELSIKEETSGLPKSDSTGIIEHESTIEEPVRSADTQERVEEHKGTSQIAKSNTEGSALSLDDDITIDQVAPAKQFAAQDNFTVSEDNEEINSEAADVSFYNEKGEENEFEPTEATSPASAAARQQIAEFKSESTPSKKLSRSAPVSEATKPASVSITEEVVLEEIFFEDSSLESSSNLSTIEPKVGWSYYYQYLSDSLRYPAAALNKKIEGKVYVEIQVDEEGTIIEISILKGLDIDCDREATRLVLEGPSFKADSVGGKAIVPVVFKLDD